MNKLILLGVVLMVSCKIDNYSSGPEEEITDPDSTIIIEYGGSRVDMGEERKTYIGGYGKEIVSRDTVSSADKHLIITTRNYCLFDSALVIPEEYVWEGTHEEFFISHNYETEVQIALEDSLIYSGIIRKADFKHLMYENFYTYGRLFAPNFRGLDSLTEQFNFGMSISIPLTDLGQGMKYGIRVGEDPIISE